MYKKFLRTLRTSGLAILTLNGISPVAEAVLLDFEKPLLDLGTVRWISLTAGDSSEFPSRVCQDFQLGNAPTARCDLKASINLESVQRWCDGHPGPYAFRLTQPGPYGSANINVRYSGLFGPAAVLEILTERRRLPM